MELRILVLGGTAWLGGVVAATAEARGHHVTCLARGESGRAPDGVELVRADRWAPDAYRSVAGVDWDAVVDVSRQPGQVASAVAALADRAARFLFVSSGNVYADHATPDGDESAELLAPLAGDVMESMRTYGQAKVACERHVLRAFGADRALIARAGLIGGPGDVSDRSGYWPMRFARPAAPDGSVLIPDVPGLAAQLVDVRDLAAWLVDCCERVVSGVFDAVGERMPLAEHLRIARAVAGHDGPLVAVGQDWLLDHDVESWAGDRSLPLWLPLPEYAGFTCRMGAAAVAAGLRRRPLSETLADVLAWELARQPHQPRLAGLPDEEERLLIEAARRSGASH